MIQLLTRSDHKHPRNLNNALIFCTQNDFKENWLKPENMCELPVPTCCNFTETHFTQVPGASSSLIMQKTSRQNSVKFQ